MFGQDVDPDLTIELLDAVSYEDVREVAASLPEELSVACVGPHTAEELEAA